MAYLNKQEREALLNELVNMSFNRAKGKLRRMDPKGRLAFHRNVQSPTSYHTRFDLEGLGTRVTLIEREVDEPTKKEGRVAAKFELAEVIVEPLPGNRT
jgi:hypothetical protein